MGNLWAIFCIFACRFEGGDAQKTDKNNGNIKFKIMATYKFYICSVDTSDDKRSEIRVRFRGGRKYDQRAGTGIFINNNNWDNEKGMPKDKRSSKYSDECDEVKTRLFILEQYLQQCWNSAQTADDQPTDILAQWMNDVDWVSEDKSAYIGGRKVVVKEWRIESKSAQKIAAIERKKEAKKFENRFFLDAMKIFAQEQLENGKICARRYDHYNSVIGLWDRMEMVNGRRYHLSEIDTEDMYNFRRFILKEHTFWEKDKQGNLVPKEQYARLYKDYPVTLKRGVPERSLNYVNTEMKYIIAFWHWLLRVKDCKLNDVFASFERDTTVFGTPFFLDSNDRNTLFNADLSGRPALAVQRDIFVFQSLIGCRVSDLMRLKKSNIIDGEFLQYVAGKTKDKSGKMLNVPLHKDAKTILERYSDLAGDKLLPFISSQKYNEAIKEVFRAVPEVDRIVSVLNPITRQEEQKYLHEVASSHMARRNFCGNLYEAGFADSDIGSMSGHSEKSREIARYRKVSVDRQMKMIDSL